MKLLAPPSSADPLAPIYTPIAQVWQASLYDQPDAPPSEEAVRLGRQLAASLSESQGLYVSDHRAGVISYVSPGIEHLLGYSAADFATNIYAIIHPDDRAIVAEITVLVNQFVIQHLGTGLADVVFSIDYRVQHARGHWLRVLRQNIALVYEKRGGLVGAAALLTDITAHKHTTDVRFHMNQPGFARFVRQQQLQALPVALSAREQEIALLVLEDLTSQAIAAQLQLRESTVNTHRRNIKRKVGSHDLYRLLRHLDTDPRP